MQPVVFVLKQPATAVDQDLFLWTGWRPGLVIGFAGHTAIWHKVDGVDDDSQHVEALRENTTGQRLDSICKIVDDGVELYADNTQHVRVASMVSTLVCFPQTQVAVHEATFSTGLPTRRSNYGSGTQFDETDQDAAVPVIYKRT